MKYVPGIIIDSNPGGALLTNETKQQQHVWFSKEDWKCGWTRDCNHYQAWNPAHWGRFESPTTTTVVYRLFDVCDRSSAYININFEYRFLIFKFELRLLFSQPVNRYSFNIPRTEVSGGRLCSPAIKLATHRRSSRWLSFFVGNDHCPSPKNIFVYLARNL